MSSMLFAPGSRRSVPPSRALRRFAYGSLPIISPACGRGVCGITRGTGMSCSTESELTSIGASRTAYCREPCGSRLWPCGAVVEPASFG